MVKPKCKKKSQYHILQEGLNLGNMIAKHRDCISAEVQHSLAFTTVRRTSINDETHILISSLQIPSAVTSKSDPFSSTCAALMQIDMIRVLFSRPVDETFPSVLSATTAVVLAP